MNALKENLSLFLKFSVKLGGISNVIDVLESSFKGSLSAKLHDLHHLQESILKTKQVSFPEILASGPKPPLLHFLFLPFFFLGRNTSMSTKKLHRFTISLCYLH